MTFLLYELSKNHEVQQNLCKLTCDTQNTQVLNLEVLNKFKLGKAIIKEALRLHPVSVGIGRYLARPAGMD